MSIKIYACSVGENGKDYVDENLKRIVGLNKFILNQDAIQKGLYSSINVGDILILKYRDQFIAYGECLGLTNEDDEDGWSLRAPVKKWYFKNDDNHKEGISTYGIGGSTEPGAGQMGAVKELKFDFGLSKMNEIDAHSELYKLIKNQNKVDQELSDLMKLLLFKKQIILQGPPGTGKTRTAKLIAKQMLNLDNIEGLNNHEQVKVIQFHPSFTYEDFVRGITAKPNEDSESIIYKGENKVLGNFAEIALSNYLSNKGKNENHSIFENKLSILLEDIRSKLDNEEGYTFGDKSTAKIIAIREDGLLYYFPNRKEIKYKILFSDIEKVFDINDQIEKATDLRDREKIIGLTMKGKYPYYYMFLQQLNRIEISNPGFKKQELKDYIFIIDEINRANLSSVLGELIYALEYRNEKVESMYEVNGSNKLTLPPNLYIIGTMNTADRSVGHIDYAIRRRFAFVDVLPKDLSVELNGKFASELFHKVTALFTDDEYQTPSLYLSEEFEPKQVALGHSYFIDKSDEGGDIKTRWNYEIKPILLEYIRDGVLKSTASNKIQEIETTLGWE